MDQNVKKANEVKMKTVVKNLERRNMTGHYCETKEDAVNRIMELISEDDLVSWGGSVTLGEIGVKEALAEGGYNVFDPMKETEPVKAMEARRKALGCDVFLSSANAITMDGEIVNIDGTGNRAAAIIFGPKKVILVAGANKLVLDERDAIDRIKNDACPPNCVRLGRETPCAITGKCGNCLKKGQTICSYTVTTRFSPQDDRIHVVLVNDTLGY